MNATWTIALVRLALTAVEVAIVFGLAWTGHTDAAVVVAVMGVMSWMVG